MQLPCQCKKWSQWVAWLICNFDRKLVKWLLMRPFNISHLSHRDQHWPILTKFDQNSEAVLSGATRRVNFFIPLLSILKLTQKYTKSRFALARNGAYRRNFKNPFHSWLNFYTPLVWCLIFRAPSIHLFWFLYTPSVHEIVKKAPLAASHTRSVQYLSAPPPGSTRHWFHLWKII